MWLYLVFFRLKVKESELNRKVTDYFPVRRSCRKSKAELKVNSSRIWSVFKCFYKWKYPFVKSVTTLSMKRSDISYQLERFNLAFLALLMRIERMNPCSTCGNYTVLSYPEMNMGLLFCNSVRSSGTLMIWSGTEWKRGWRWALITLCLWRQTFPGSSICCFPSGEEYRRERKRDFCRQTVSERPVCCGVSWGFVRDFWCQSKRVSIRSGPLDGLLHVLFPLPRQNLLVSVCVRTSANGHACALMQDLMWTMWSVALLWTEGMDYVCKYVISDTTQVKLGMLSFFLWLYCK